MPPRILLLEDEQAIADTLMYALRSEGFEVVHVRLAAEAEAALQAQPPDLAILDVGLPDDTGFNVCRRLRLRSTLPVIFLTARDDEIDRILGLELGADDYVSKPFSPREVCARVRAILRRTGCALDEPRRPPPPGPDTPTRCRLDEASQRVVCDGRPLHLTRYEYLLLATLMRRPGRIYSRSELMRQVWDDASASSDRTVDAHVKLLRAKLRERGVPGDWIETYRHMGYAWQPAG